MSDTSDSQEQPAAEFQPYVPAQVVLPEFTLKAALLGMVFGVIFGAANAYLGLLAGLTISTSIPIAVMTVAAFRSLKAMGKGGSILEANLAQTIGSASSSVASGVIFTLPALFLWGYEPKLLQMTLLAMFGGLLGVLFMIPLRPYLIEKEHNKLPYPEGTACAEVLRASELGGSQARGVFVGLGAGALFKALTDLLGLIPKTVSTVVPGIPKAAVACKLSAALMGVGFILGPRIGSIMVGGGLLSSLLLIPVLGVFGDRLLGTGDDTLAAMTTKDIWDGYVRYIGAGAVAAGGLITLIRSIPTMIESFRIGAQQIRARMGNEAAEELPRTRRDLPLGFVGVGVLVIVVLLGLLPQAFAIDSIAVRCVAAFMVVVCSFFFVTVSSRIVGLVGVTSNPTSGMTIASLLATASVFLLFDWTGDVGKMAALTVGCVIAISASIAGDTSQDLKTGLLLGATPRRQQIGELLGVLTSATAVCAVVRMLGNTYGFGTEDLPAPQATLMKTVIEGVLDQALPWTLVLTGVGIALLAEAARIPSLPFAVGVYLPVATMVPVFLGGILRWRMTRTARDEAESETRRNRGVLFGSGLVGGAGLLGVLIAGYASVMKSKPKGLLSADVLAGPWMQIVGAVVFAGLAWIVITSARGKS